MVVDYDKLGELIALRNFLRCACACAVGVNSNRSTQETGFAAVVCSAIESPGFLRRFNRQACKGSMPCLKGRFGHSTGNTGC